MTARQLFRRAAGATAGCALATLAQAAEQVVITGSVVERALSEAPYAVSALTREELRGAGPLVNLSEALAAVPGFVVANRSNYAQDLQISSRGFGARTGFGVRGVRLYADGIPANGPDGQGQVSHFDLAGAERVEVLRGPFSVLYGNSSGGVISLVAAAPKAAQAEVAADAASFGLHQVRAAGNMPLNAGLDLRMAVASMQIEGFRPQSQASKDSFQARLAWEQGADSLVVQLNDLDQPADDPLGLTRAQFNADALQAAPQATQFDTRKSTRQTQGGLRWRHRFGVGALREASLAAYQGRRAVVQFLAIPPAAQTPASHGGGVIDFDREFGGVDARLRLGWDKLDLVAGVALDRQRDDRRGYENFNGTGAAQVLGVVGRLRRDEVNRVRSDDAYAQAEWALPGAVALTGGVRSGRVRLAASDAFLSNGDDSGERRFSYANPVIGARWGVANGLNLHASAARGYESPTLGDVAYRPDGNAGLNFALLPQRSEQAELGVKWRHARIQADAALFEVRVRDEIGVFSNTQGRATFQNVGRTLRRGAEGSLRWQAGAGLSAALALSWLDATYRDTFLTCAGTCTTPTVAVPAGNRIAGTQRSSGYAEIAWRGEAAGEWALEVRGAGETSVNDVNSDRAAGYGIVNLRWRQRFALAPLGLAELLLRVDNAADRRYAGSVIVNEGNQRFFETGAPRSYLVALRLLFP